MFVVTRASCNTTVLGALPLSQLVFRQLHRLLCNACVHLRGGPCRSVVIVHHAIDRRNLVGTTIFAPAPALPVNTTPRGGDPRTDRPV